MAHRVSAARGADVAGLGDRSLTAGPPAAATDVVLADEGSVAGVGAPCGSTVGLARRQAEHERDRTDPPAGRGSPRALACIASPGHNSPTRSASPNGSDARSEGPAIASETRRMRAVSEACRIGPGQSGDCRIRVNLDGRLVASTYGLPSAVHVDPIEKKPLIHFLPGTPIFSHRHRRLQPALQELPELGDLADEPRGRRRHAPAARAVVRGAPSEGCRSVAYTYTEPLVYYEYTLETSRPAQEGRAAQRAGDGGLSQPRARWRSCSRS